MKTTAIWLGCATPWVVALSLLAIFGVDAYQDGYRLVAGMHAFKWFLHLIIGAFVYVPAMLIAVVTLIAGRHRLRARRQLGFAICLPVTSLVVPMLALSVISYCFFRGREAGYKTLDYRAIHRACVDLSEGADRAGTPFLYAKWDHGSTPRPAQLPKALADLAPLQVHATRSAVVVQIDGGGPMYHEGIGVVTSGDPVLQADVDTVFRRLDAELPVYLFRLYDSSVFLDRVAETDAQANPADESGSENPGND